MTGRRIGFRALNRGYGRRRSHTGTGNADGSRIKTRLQLFAVAHSGGGGVVRGDEIAHGPKAGRDCETVVYSGPHALGMRREDRRNGRDRLKNGRKDCRSGQSRFRNGLEDPDRGQSAFHNREIDFDCDRRDRADLLGRCSPRSQRVEHSSNRFRAREKEPGRLTRALFPQSK